MNVPKTMVDVNKTAATRLVHFIASVKRGISCPQMARGVKVGCRSFYFWVFMNALVVILICTCTYDIFYNIMYCDMVKYMYD